MVFSAFFLKRKKLLKGQMKKLLCKNKTENIGFAF